MPLVGFEPTIPASEKAKTVHALDRSTTVTGMSYNNVQENVDTQFNAVTILSIAFLRFIWKTK
jgi:hypothetical protein